MTEYEDVKYKLVAGDENLAGQDASRKLTTMEMQKIPGGDENTSNKNLSSASSESGDRKFLYIAACVANLAAFTCGTSFGWTSPIIPKLNGEVDPENNPLSVPMTIDQGSWLGAFLPLGAALGPIAAGLFVDKLGRKKSLLISMVPFIVAFLLAIFAKEVNLLFLVRFLCGLAVGGVFTVLPMYIGEIAEDDVRGALGSFMQLFITFGILYSYAIGPYVSITLYNISCLIAPSLFLVLFLIYIPESPYHLVFINDHEGSEKALMKIRGKTSGGVQKELLDIKNAINETKENKGTFMDIFKSRGLVKALIISVGLVSLQQFSGINIILFYTQNIFAATGSTIPPAVCTIIIGIVQVTSSFITPAVVDRMGKRFLLTFSAVGMGISEAVLGYYFFLQEKKTDVSALFWLPVVCLILYNITYCIGFGPLPWAVMGEVFPGNVKSAASTVTASGCWILAFFLTKFFSNVTDIIGLSFSFWIFTLCCFSGFFFVHFYVPETTGKSLQEVQDILNDRKK